MRWLEESQDSAARALRAGLDRAAERKDELALRRIWSRIAEPELLMVPQGGRRAMALGGVGMALAGAAVAAFLVLRAPPALEVELPAAVSALGEGAVPAGAAPVPADPVEEAEVTESEPVLQGPATVRTGARQGRRVLLRGGAQVSVEPRSVLAVDAGHRPVLQQGSISLEVPRQRAGERFSVAAGPYVIVVVGTRFHVNVVRHSVGVKVDEGIVEVWRGDEVVTLVAGDSWTGRLRGAGPDRPRQRMGGRPRQEALAPASAPRRMALVDASHTPDRSGKPETRVPVAAAGFESAANPPAPSPPIAAPAPPASAPPPAAPVTRPSDLFREARAAAADGEPERALAILSKLAQGTGPAAENASYESGRILRDQLLRPREALKTWRQYRGRFPRGLLQVETDVSILETLVSIGDQEAALAEAESFLRRHPGSERRAEVMRLAERLRRTLAGTGAVGSAAAVP
jgi:ferric-dicitrate binding protein FerR (iron transport regulator)